jgi:hypothetical protein
MTLVDLGAEQERLANIGRVVFGISNHLEGYAPRGSDGYEDKAWRGEDGVVGNVFGSDGSLVDWIVRVTIRTIMLLFEKKEDK